MTTTDTRAALTALQDGRPIADIAAQTGLSTGQIAALAETAGATSEHARAALRELIEALAWGEQHDAKKARNLAARARRALTDLVQMRHEETAVAQAREEVAELKKQLADAEAKLRTVRTGRASATAAASDGAGSKEERRAIRVWARAQGHQVADRGLLPGHLVTAYRNRNTSAPQDS
jgi:polyhydroxyalkanoate synthesis regulator phasin